MLLISEESDEAEVTEKNDEVTKVIVKAKGMSLSINSTILMNKGHRITFSRPLLLEPANRCSFTTSLPTNKFIELNF